MALPNRDIVRCEAAWLLATIGTWSFAIVLALYAYYEHGPAGVGLAVAARVLPPALLSRGLAHFSERWSPRVVVTSSVIGRIAMIEGIALAGTLEAPFALLLALVAGFELASTPHRSLRSDLVLAAARDPRDLRALGAAPTISAAGAVLGAMLAGLLVLEANLHAGFALTGLLFVPVLALSRRLPTDGLRRRARHEGAPAAPLAAIRGVAGHPWARMRLAVTSAVVMVEATLDLLIVVVALDVLHAGDGAVGWLRGGFAAGGLLAASLATRRLCSGRLAQAAAAGFLLAGVPLAVIAAWPSTPSALVLIALLGAGYVLLQVSLPTLTQRIAASRGAGEVAIAERFVHPAAQALGAGLGTWLVLGLGDRSAVAVAGLLLPGLALIALGLLRRAEAGVEIPAQPLRLIRRVPLLAAVPPLAMENLALCAEPRSFSRGQTVVGRDAAVDRLYMVEAGAATVAATDGSALGPGACFGRAAILPRADAEPAPIAAADSLRTWTITPERLIGSFTGVPARREPTI